MKEMTDTKTKKIGAMLRLIAMIAALIMISSLSLPLFRKNSALSAVGERTLAEMTPFSTAVAYYSGREIARVAQKPRADDSGYQTVAALLSQVTIQQGYERLYLLYRDQNKAPHYLENGNEFPVSVYKPVKSMIDKIYTGKSVGAYANDLILREDGRKVAVSCLPIYGSGRTVLAVLVAESDPGNTGYHLVGPVNLYYVGGVAGAVFLLCVLLLYVGRRYQRAKAEREVRRSAGEQADAEKICEEPILPEDDFQLPLDLVEQPPVTGEPLGNDGNDPPEA